MRKLNDTEKEAVKIMLESRGFKVMEGLVEEFKVDIMNEMLTMPLGDKTTIDKLTGKQNYLKGIKDFIRTVKSASAGIGKKEKTKTT